VGGCGGREKPDYLARFLAAQWDDLDTCDPARLALDLRRYVELDHPIYPTDDPHCVALHRFLFRVAPDPKGLLPLFAPHGRSEVDNAVLKHDAIASTVATSFMRRIAEAPSDPHRAALYDALAFALVYFAFDPVYGDAHTETSEDLGSFFGAPELPPNAESRAAVAHHLPALLRAWRARVTRKGTSTFFGLVLRHLGADGAEALALERHGLDEEERKDLLLRLGEEETLRERARMALVGGTADASVDVRKAALTALRKQGAPVEDLDPLASDEELDALRPPLLEWAKKTKP
jgi:hypothetical protein